GVELRLHHGRGALPQRHHADDGGDADDDAQHGEARAHAVPQQAAPGQQEGHARLHAATASRMRPSLTWIVRRVWAATAESWVTRTMVSPSRLSSRNSFITS